MVVKYKNYEGALIFVEQIKGGKFMFILQDSDNVKISFTADMSEIRIKNCVGNTDILSEVLNK